MSREELNEMIYIHLEAIRLDVKAYAEGIGVDFKPVSLYIDENSVFAFSIYDHGVDENKYLIDMFKTEWDDKPIDGRSGHFVE